jgi:hypothetical protein
MALGRINLDVGLERKADGWLFGDWEAVGHGQYVDDPSKFRDGEPGRVYGPCEARLTVAPDGGRQLQIR